MSETDTRPGSLQHLCSLREHVLGPLSNAAEITERERRAVAKERDAFGAFADRVRDIAPESPDEPSIAVVRRLEDSQSSAQCSLRRAYRETVMDMPHYDQEYGEPIVENVAAELSPELATFFDSTTRSTLSASAKERIVAGAEEAAESREEFRGTLDSELDSLRSSRRDLQALLDELDSSVVPGWYYQQFHEQLLAIIHARQSKLEDRTAGYFDGHNLCTYLYSAEPRTYPVLTAVARLLDSVSVRK
jgi:hypothetical protein